MNINTIIKTSLLFLLVGNLSARDNPFIATKVFTQIQESSIIADEKPAIEPIRIIEIEEEIIPTIKPVVIKPIQIEEPKLEEVLITKTEIQDPITKETVPVEIKSYKYNLLDFVKIDILSDIMSIDTKSKLITHFILKDENKIVFDFVGAQNFYTKRESLSSHQDFKKLIVGAHPKYKYFRVVIQTSTDVKGYKTIVEKSGLITITKIIDN